MIIKSILDNDAYKFSMGQIVFHRYSNVHVRYDFASRNYTIKWFIDELQPEITKEIEHLADLKLTSKEYDYLQTLPYLTPDYIDFLDDFRFDPDRYVKYIGPDKSVPGMGLLYIEGPWLYTILFEVPILAIVSEIASKENYKTIKNHNYKHDYIEKYIELTGPRGVNFTDFGTRRRFSTEWHEHVVETLKNECFKMNPPRFGGTSNVHLAMKYGLKPIGTMAHEYIMAHQALVHPLDSQKVALRVWLEEYGDKLAIALSDTLGINKFLRDFDPVLARSYSGVRQDSGDPKEWAYRIIDHYDRMDIETHSKTLVFSDGLNPEKAMEIEKEHGGAPGLFGSRRTETMYGIGTDLTNRMNDGWIAPQIVIKMTECQHRPVAKISDSSGKCMCRDPAYLQWLTEAIKKEGVRNETASH